MEDLSHHLQKQIHASRDFFWHRIRWKAVSHYLPAKGSFNFLDIGAGAGLFGQYLNADFPEGRYYFVEPLESLRQHLATTFGSDRDLSEKQAYPKIHSVVLLDVIEHMQDDKAFVETIVRKMDSSSRLIITVPAFQFFWSPWDEILGHFRRYSKENMRELLQNLPLTIKESSYLFPEMIPLALLRKLKKKEENKEGKDAEFPDLPKAVNAFFYALASVSFFSRRLFPFGTSLFIVAEKN